VVGAWVRGKEKVAVIKVHPLSVGAEQSTQVSEFGGGLEIASGEKNEWFCKYCQQVSRNKNKENPA
jgi:hypothetical protein